MSRQIPSESDIPMHGWYPYSAMHRERIRAHEKFNRPPIRSQEQLPWDHDSWLRVLVEEVGECARVLNDAKLSPATIIYDTKGMLRIELIQTGAMVAAWLDAIQGEN